MKKYVLIFGFLFCVMHNVRPMGGQQVNIHIDLEQLRIAGRFRSKALKASNTLDALHKLETASRTCTGFVSPRAVALSDLAQIYFEGSGVEKDEKMAKQLWLRSAALGCPAAQVNLMSIYLCKQKYEKAILYYESAMMQKELFPSQLRIALFNQIFPFYLAKKKPTKIISMLFQEAEKNNGLACFKLGHMFCEGNYLDQDTEQAIKYFEKGAQNNCIESLIALGDLFYLGILIEQDLPRALGYFKQAEERDANNEYIKNMISTIENDLTGEVVPVDYEHVCNEVVSLNQLSSCNNNSEPNDALFDPSSIFIN